MIVSNNSKPVTGKRLSPRFFRPNGGRLPALLGGLAWTLHSLPEPGRLAATRLLERAKFRRRLPTMNVTYRDGFTFRIKAGDPMYTRIFLQGAWEPPESCAVRALLTPGDFAIDIGANYGWFTLLMASSVGRSGLVWSFEPVPPTAEELRYNISLNSFDNIRLFESAVGASAGEVNINVFEGLPHGHASAATLGRDDYVSHPVLVRTLDQLLEEAAGRLPAIIKVDVEGFEMQVLDGSSRLLRSPNPPIWMLEVNYETSAALNYRPARLIEKLLSQNEYKVFSLERSRARHKFFVVPVKRPEESQQDDTWICVPPSRLDRLTNMVNMYTV
jgi:FkbM family methyltransferase